MGICLLETVPSGEYLESPLSHFLIIKQILLLHISIVYDLRRDRIRQCFSKNPCVLNVNNDTIERRIAL